MWCCAGEWPAWPWAQQPEWHSSLGMPNRRLPLGMTKVMLLLGRAHARSWILVGDQVMMPADLERLHKELREFERIDAVSDEMRAVRAGTRAVVHSKFWKRSVGCSFVCSKLDNPSPGTEGFQIYFTEHKRTDIRLYSTA
jgi:hypothetical protein